MNVYTNLTTEQVTSFYRLVKLMQRLRITGVLYAETRAGFNTSHSEGTVSWYQVSKIGYSPDKTFILTDEMLEQVFGRPSKPPFKDSYHWD